MLYVGVVGLLGRIVATQCPVQIFHHGGQGPKELLHCKCAASLQSMEPLSLLSTKKVTAARRAAAIACLYCPRSQQTGVACGMQYSSFLTGIMPGGKRGVLQPSFVARAPTPRLFKYACQACSHALPGCCCATLPPYAVGDRGGDHRVLHLVRLQLPVRLFSALIAV